MKKTDLTIEETKYRIHLYNLQATTKKFWCFLDMPQLSHFSGVYANSNISQDVSPYINLEKALFVIPLQYRVGVGATDKAVALNAFIETNNTRATDLGTEWLASYYQKEGTNPPPTLQKEGETPSSSISIVTNTYNKSQEHENEWYGNMTFGIGTLNEFTGISWSPNSNFIYQIGSVFNFYITVGTYSKNKLASINAIAFYCAKLTPKSFDSYGECTVIYMPDGSWVVKPGYVPPVATGVLSMMTNAHADLATAHKNLVELTNSKNL